MGNEWVVVIGGFAEGPARVYGPFDSPEAAESWALACSDSRRKVVLPVMAPSSRPLGARVVQRPLPPVSPADWVNPDGPTIVEVR